MASTIDPKTGLPITNQAIPTSALSTPQTPFTVVPPADTTPILTSAMNTGGSYTQQAQESTLLDQQAAQAQQDRVAGAGTVADLTRMAGGRLQERANLAQTNGENDLLKQISGYNTQAQGLIREATAIPLQTGQAYQGTSGTQAGVASVNRDLLQRNALQSLTLAQSAAIAQGNYDVAKNLADQQVNAKYAQIDAEIAARKINEEALYKNVTDPAIKKALEARMALTKKEEQAQAEKKAAETAVNNMLIEASPVAPPDVIAKATKIKNEGGTAIQVAQALGKYGGDFLKNELLKEQIKTQVSNRAMDAEKLRLEKLKLDIAQSKADGTNVSGKPLKVSNAEITNLNEAITAKNSVISLVKQYKENIKNYGTGESFGKAATQKESLGTLLKLAMKNLEKTGALDAGTIAVLSGTIPENEFFATDAGAQQKLDDLVNTITAKTDEYVRSYRGTSAELDPRTKRAYGDDITSTGNAAADDYFKKTSQALNNVTSTLSTPNAVTAGFTDNQK